MRISKYFHCVRVKYQIRQQLQNSLQIQFRSSSRKIWKCTGEEKCMSLHKTMCYKKPYSEVPVMTLKSNKQFHKQPSIGVLIKRCSENMQ